MREETRSKLNMLEATPAPARPYLLPMPLAGQIYDYQLEKEGGAQWSLWSDVLATRPAIAKDATFNQIIVPTTDTVRYTALMQMLITHQKACLFVGPTGTGKSVYIVVGLAAVAQTWAPVRYSITPSLRHSVTPSLRHSVTPLLTKLLFCVLLHYFLLRYSVSPVISVPLHLYRRTLLLAT